MRYFWGVLLVCIFFIFPFVVHAEDFQKDYTVDYYLQQKGDAIETKAIFNLKITNLTGEIMIKTFSLSFPKSFTIHDLSATNNGQPITLHTTQGADDINVQVEFTDPEVGKGTANNLALSFFQDNLFKVNGNVWEVILPTIDPESRNSYQVRVHLPENIQKKITIAKPAPDAIVGDTITWNNPKSKTIYAVFGEKQLYDVKLTYHLLNPKFTPVYTDIALIPDTAYQKTYLKSLKPAPSMVYLDADGNYMARYILKPKEGYNVNYEGVIESSVKPRDEVRPFVKAAFAKQKKDLLATTGFWKNDETKRFSSIPEVYSYVTTTFSYNYKRLSERVNRLGAQEALADPKNAVCTEFTDGFVALARDNGLYAREIQGYGFSNDPQLRPLSLQSDTLHAWPEYYDQEQNLWVPVDPTWENTSGIDYFNSFDLNHIAFVIHGKRSDYPYPAGTYKQNETQDITITATSKSPTAKLTYTFEGFSGQKRIHPHTRYTGTIIIKNTGNTYAWSIPLSLPAKNISVNTQSQTIDVIAPYEEKKIPVTYTAKLNAIGDGTLDVLLDGKKIGTVDFAITPVIVDILIVAIPALLLGGVVIYIITIRRKRRV